MSSRKADELPTHLRLIRFAPPERRECRMHNFPYSGAWEIDKGEARCLACGHIHKIELRLHNPRGSDYK